MPAHHYCPPLPRFLELPLPLRGISIQVARNKDELLYLVVFDTSSPYLVAMLLHSEIQEVVVSQNVNITYEIEKKMLIATPDMKFFH